jgi:hypothetical protein
MIVGSDGQLCSSKRSAQRNPNNPGWTPEGSEPAGKMDAPQEHEPTISV